MSKTQTRAKHRLTNADTREILIQHLQVADSIWSRFRGWMFRRYPAPSSGILLRPCGSIHTMWMLLTIDVAFLSNNNEVLGIRKRVRPWRLAFAPKGTTGVLETPAGQTSFTVGTMLQIEDT